jgi:predicted AAA+ superfamily ATPase
MLKHYKRPIYQQLSKLLTSDKELIQVIVGPRQVGKSTLAMQIAESFTGAIHFEN